MPGGHPGHDALTKRIPSVRAEVAASPFARSVLDSIVPCPHGRDTYLLKEQVFYHACCRAGCWVRTSNVWTWLRRMMNHPDQTSAALREPSNQKAMLKFRIEELRDAAGARDETRLACEEFLKDWSDSKYVECVPRPADATHTLRTMGKKPADGEAPKSYKCSALRGFRIEPPPHLGAVAVLDIHEDVVGVALEEPVQHGVQDSARVAVHRRHVREVDHLLLHRRDAHELQEVHVHATHVAGELRAPPLPVLLLAIERLRALDELRVDHALRQVAGRGSRSGHGSRTGPSLRSTGSTEPLSY